ncbi:MAG: DUF4422 domain-containing protein [Bifidobacterium sp.]|nr:DUF4422 domain-containing protein [Bifidobacterium sp.]
MKDTTVYIVSHKDFKAPELPGYEPILAGAERNHADIAVKDNTGDNISAKNPEYCELTAQYWVWRNTQDSSDNVGFVHYRRYFYTDARKKQIVPAEQFSRDLETYDVVLPEPWVLTKTIGEQFAQFHDAHDLEITRQVLQGRHPQYVAAFDSLMESHSLTAYNMFVMDRERFDAYMSWLFDVLGEVERRTDVKDYDSYNQRLYGFLSERLLNVWVNANALRAKRYPVYMPDDNWIKEWGKAKIKSLLFARK